MLSKSVVYLRKMLENCLLGVGGIGIRFRGSGGRSLCFGNRSSLGLRGSSIRNSFGSGSIGFQIGVQDAQIAFIILTEKGLAALMDSQFKVGADASVAVASFGAGVSGATTAALRADIVAFAQARGLFAGIALDGSMISQRSEWNQAYYGQYLSPQQIVLNRQGNNQGADPLREVLAQLAAQPRP